ncbi:hypothetical protein BLNAU_5616 [Blattamonas nauphoetae]|uniref:Uncharacterized protein n=1 Tax=Blattamonas nauphoetae TaxID=2049346 RepID=A0ABQ9Y6B0_9EUKA|nr:hypothetical protein BLNAU_5616 [Blattamonas nauphoetae]
MNLVEEIVNDAFITPFHFGKPNDELFLPCGNSYTKINSFTIQVSNQDYLHAIPHIGTCHYNLPNDRGALQRRQGQPGKSGLGDAIYLIYNDALAIFKLPSFEEYRSEMCTTVKDLPFARCRCSAAYLSEDDQPFVVVCRRTGRVDIVNPNTLSIVQSVNTEFPSTSALCTSVSVNYSLDRPLIMLGYDNGTVLGYQMGLPEVEWPRGHHSREFIPHPERQKAWDEKKKRDAELPPDKQAKQREKDKANADPDAPDLEDPPWTLPAVTKPIRHYRSFKRVRTLLQSIAQVLSQNPHANLLGTNAATTSPALFRDVMLDNILHDEQIEMNNTPLFTSAMYYLQPPEPRMKNIRESRMSSSGSQSSTYGSHSSSSSHNIPNPWPSYSSTPPLSSLSYYPFETTTDFPGFHYYSRSQRFNPICRWSISKGYCHCIAQNPLKASPLVAFGSDEGYCVIFNITKEEFIVAFRTYFGACLSISWSSDGQVIAFGGADNSATIYTDLDTHPRPLCRIRGHSAWIKHLRFDPSPSYTLFNIHTHTETSYYDMDDEEMTKSAAEEKRKKREEKKEEKKHIDELRFKCKEREEDLRASGTADDLEQIKKNEKVYQLITGSDDTTIGMFMFNILEIDEMAQKILDTHRSRIRRQVMRMIERDQIQQAEKNRSVCIRRGIWSDDEEDAHNAMLKAQREKEILREKHYDEIHRREFPSVNATHEVDKKLIVWPMYKATDFLPAHLKKRQPSKDRRESGHRSRSSRRDSSDRDKGSKDRTGSKDSKKGSQTRMQSNERVPSVDRTSKEREGSKERQPKSERGSSQPRNQSKDRPPSQERAGSTERTISEGDMSIRSDGKPETSAFYPFSQTPSDPKLTPLSGQFSSQKEEVKPTSLPSSTPSTGGTAGGPGSTKRPDTQSTTTATSSEKEERDRMEWRTDEEFTLEEDERMRANEQEFMNDLLRKHLKALTCPGTAGRPYLTAPPTGPNPFVVYGAPSLSMLPVITPNKRFQNAKFNMISNVVWEPGILTMSTVNGYFVVWMDLKTKNYS